MKVWSPLSASMAPYWQKVVALDAVWSRLSLMALAIYAGAAV